MILAVIEYTIHNNMKRDMKRKYNILQFETFSN